MVEWLWKSSYKKMACVFMLTLALDSSMLEPWRRFIFFTILIKILVGLGFTKLINLLFPRENCLFNFCMVHVLYMWHQLFGKGRPLGYIPSSTTFKAAEPQTHFLIGLGFYFVFSEKSKTLIILKSMDEQLFFFSVSW